MQKMKKLAAPALCAVSAAMLSGCGLFRDPPPPPAPVAPLIVKYQIEVDPVHVRDVSIRRQEEHRGGAALRAEEWSHVLWSKHYEGEKVEVKQRAEHDRQLEDRKEKLRQDASIYAAKKKDASVYAVKDVSVYAKKDASVYAKKTVEEKAMKRFEESAVLHKNGLVTIGGHNINVSMFYGKTFFWMNPDSKDYWIGSVGTDRITFFRLDDSSARIASMIETAHAGKNLGTVDGKPVLSRSTRITIDCTNSRTVAAQSAAHDGYFGRGRVIEGYTSDIKPDDAEALKLVMNAACAVQD